MVLSWLGLTAGSRPRVPAGRRNGKQPPESPYLAAEFGQVNAELERLRAILRGHGLDADNGAG